MDFTYEVSRALSICQTAVLLVDCLQGIQAQTMANLMLAYEAGLEILPVINKVDLAPDEGTIVELEKKIKNVLLDDSCEIVRVSAKTGVGVPNLLRQIKFYPPPTSDRSKPLKAVVFDSWFEPYRGVICLVSVIDGVLKAGDPIVSSHTNVNYIVSSIGILNPFPTPMESLAAGQVGFLITGMKTRSEAKIGDTFYNPSYPVDPMPGFKDMKPMVRPFPSTSLPKAFSRGVTHLTVRCFLGFTQFYQSSLLN